MSIHQRLRTAIAVLILGCASVAHGQIRSGTITGTVTDTTGAIIPGADVVVTNDATGVTTTLVTSDAGLFTAPYLPAGRYTVAVTLAGFTPFRQTGLDLGTAQTARVTIELKVSQVGETIEVQAAATQLQTDKTSVEGAMGSRMIEAIPNVTQNPLQYAMMQAGAVGRNSTSDTQSLDSFGIGVNGRRNFSAVGVNGGRAFTNDIQLDGLPVMGGGYNEASVVPNTEGLQEVKVISNNFSAEYGRGQAVIAMSTKSGTNQYRGQLTYQARHESLDANSFSNNAQAIAKRPFRVNDVGGAFGGPILQNRLFFFSSYHQLRHNNTQTARATVPTALERIGDFSQSFIRDENGSAVPAQIFDPFNVVQEGPDLYRRAVIPGARIPNPDPFGLYMYSFYPLPNRAPDDVFNTNNFEATTKQTVRRHSSNNRVDLRLGNHSLYASGGISYAEIVTPRAFGTAPFNDAPGLRGDNNPYLQVGDTFVLSPTTVVDVRYGMSRINTQQLGGNKDGFSDYDSVGIPSNLQPYILFPGAAPDVNPNGFGGGNGGGSNWTSLVTGTFQTKREWQTGHSLAGSVTKTRGRWVHKAGMEYRVQLSNYADPEQASASLPSPTAHTGGNFNFEYTTANGGVASLVTRNAQRGVNAAAILLGAGMWTIRPGANVNPAFAQKYFAVYSQNDWRATSKLTVNLGLRWEVQPGPTERYDRMSGWDFNAMNAFGTQGAIAFPGVDGYSRNLWDTTYDNFGPRVGAAYQLTRNTVLRGGFGITYLPSNSGYFSGPTDYGSANFSGGTSQIPYGLTPNGVPVGRFSSPSPISPAIGGNPEAPQVYGIGEGRFPRDFKNGRATQFNVFVERMLADTWLVSIGYSGSISRNLLNRNFPIQNLQSIAPEVLAQWRSEYVASNGTLNPANQQVTNPFQPASGALLPFANILGNRTIPRQNTLFPYPLLAGGSVNASDATADYHSMQLRVSKRLSGGLQLDGHYTWSKNIDTTDTGIEDGQGFNAGGFVRNYNLNDRNSNRRLGLSDVPHRFVANLLYELPFGEDRAIAIKNPLLRAVVGDWQIGGTVIWQAGFPIFISGAGDGALNGRPDLVPGVALELPQALQGWYDGRTTVTLPSGRVYTPPVNTYLKYNPDAFAGRTVTTPNGRIVADQFWYGDSALTYDGFRTDTRFNIDFSLRRTFRIQDQMSLEVGADAMNLLNNSQFNGAYAGGLGSTNVTPNAATGLVAGAGTSNGFGTRGRGTFNPRQVMLRAALRF